jgi:putative resolvase
MWKYSQTLTNEHGINWTTLQRWRRQGKIKAKKDGNRWLYDITSMPGGKCSTATQAQVSVCYCRVSSAKQKENLSNQSRALQARFSDHHVITDVASGLNFKRPGLNRVLELALSGRLKQLVVASRDRLCRFGFALFEWLFRRQNVQLVVLDQKNTTIHPKSTAETMVQDVLAILHVFNCSMQGRRRYKATSMRPDQNTKVDPEGSKQTRKRKRGGDS